MEFFADKEEQRLTMVMDMDNVDPLENLFASFLDDLLLPSQFHSSIPFWMDVVSLSSNLSTFVSFLFKLY